MGDSVSELTQLRRYVETLAERIAALERALLNPPMPSRISPNRQAERRTSQVLLNPPIDSLISPTREQLVEAITKWRVDQGIADPQRYLQNRSTAQLRKMFDQIQAGSTYRLGRRWTIKEQKSRDG
jgi:hypothetical protein